VSGRFHIVCGHFDWDLPICCVFLFRNNGVETPGAEAATAVLGQLLDKVQRLCTPLHPPRRPAPLATTERRNYGAWLPQDPGSRIGIAELRGTSFVTGGGGEELPPPSTFVRHVPTRAEVRAAVARVGVAALGMALRMTSKARRISNASAAAAQPKFAYGIGDIASMLSKDYDIHLTARSLNDLWHEFDPDGHGQIAPTVRPPLSVCAAWLSLHGRRSSPN
jgi:hypothetical protein